MAGTDLANANTGLRDLATRFAASSVIELVNSSHVDIFNQSDHTTRHYSAHKATVLSDPVRLHLPTSSWSKCGQRAVQESHPGRFLNHSQKEVSRCGRTFDSQVAAGEKYESMLFESSSQAPHYLRKRYNPRLRRDI